MPHNRHAAAIPETAAVQARQHKAVPDNKAHHVPLTAAARKAAAKPMQLKVAHPKALILQAADQVRKAMPATPNVFIQTAVPQIRI